MIDGQHRLQAPKNGELQRLVFMYHTGTGNTLEAYETWRLLLRYRAKQKTAPRPLHCPSCGSAHMARELYSHDAGDPLTCQGCGAITRLRVESDGTGLVLRMDVVE